MNRRSFLSALASNAVASIAVASALSMGFRLGARDDDDDDLGLGQYSVPLYAEEAMKALSDRLGSVQRVYRGYDRSVAP
jgi:hypothetical protein